MTPMIVEHPLLQHKLSILRNKQTGTHITGSTHGFSGLADFKLLCL